MSRRHGAGTARTRVHASRIGEGTAWLVADRSAGDYRCYWYGGANDGRLQESATVPTAVAAVAWGRRRTTQVRIRTTDGCTRWAGTATRPSGLAHSWVDEAPAADRGTATGRAGTPVTP